VNEPVPVWPPRKPPVPRVPAHLGEDGKRLWREVWAIYELDRVETGRLTRICELTDVRRALMSERTKAAAALMLRLTAEIDRLLLQLGVGDEQQQTRSRSDAARAMAAERWRRQQARESTIRRQTFA
jgi:hypothetical protein